MKAHLIRPTNSEDADITAAAMSDPDNQPLTAAELTPFKRLPGHRGTQKSSTKIAVTIRYNSEVVEAFRATGKGWQTRMNDALKEWLKTHSEV
jgi:uncharacterized protein (DUF4415 family)